MSLREEQMNEFDRYLRQEMDTVEQNAFEERLRHSKSLTAELMNYQEMSGAIEAGYAYHEIRQQLGEIHEEVHSVSNKTTKKRTILRPLFWTTTAVAASIALILYFNPLDMVGERSEDYAQLSNEENEAVADESFTAETAEESFEGTDDGHSDNEDVLTDSVSPGPAEEHLEDYLSITQQTPRGTAFQIDNKGHFLTAGHLVKGESRVRLQLKPAHLSFEAAVIYVDDSLDFAILSCSSQILKELQAVPYQFSDEPIELGDEIFTMGYPKKDIVFTPGNISSETGFQSDPVYFESTLPSNAGHSGSPVFNENGELTGIVTAQHAKQQAATYVLKPTIIQSTIQALHDSIQLELPPKTDVSITSRRQKIKVYRTFIFELHLFE